MKDTNINSKVSKPQKRKRSRFGCHRCKKLKVKCDEQKPKCSLCFKSNKECDYSMKLTWGGRPFKNQKPNNLALGTIVSFEQKYNPENRDVIKNTDISNVSNSDGLSGKAAVHDIDIKQEIVSQKLIPQVSDSSLTIDVKDELNFSLISQQSKGDSSLESQSQSKDLLPLSDFPSLDNTEDQTTDSIQHEFQRPDTDIMSIFRELDSSNVLVKQFVSDFVLPDLSPNINNQLEQAKVEESLNKEVSPEEDDSSPETLIISESFISNPFNHTKHSDIYIPDFSQDEFMTTGFEFIQPSLQPLPDILLNNPVYRKHYHLYIEVFSKMLCPAPPQAYTENPFTCLLPRMSISSPTDGLLSLVIASSMAQGNSHYGTDYSEQVVRTLITRSLNDLFNRLTDVKEAESDYTLALILLLSCFELISGKVRTTTWKAHFIGAKKILFSRGILKAKGMFDNDETKVVTLQRSSENDLQFFFIRWFVYLDVIGSLSSGSSSNYKRSTIIWKGPKPTNLDRYRLKDIDPFMGFDLKLLEYFSEIIRLAKERETKHFSPNPLPVSLIQRALELKEEILNYLNSTEKDRNEIRAHVMNDPTNPLNKSLQDYEILRATNKIFALAGVLQIQRRIFMTSKESHLVQDLVNEITNELSINIPKTASAAYCTIFALFSCGCDVLEDEKKIFYTERIMTLNDIGLAATSVTFEVMKESWESGEYWADILSRRNLEVIFL